MMSGKGSMDSLKKKNMCNNRCCREECVCASFGLNHPEPRRFLSSMWPGPGGLYVTYRIIVAVFCVVWMVIAIDSYPFASCWFIYLTNLSFLLLNITLILQACTAVYYYSQYELKGKDGPESMWWILKLQWVLYNISVPAAVKVTVNYWLLVFYPGKEISSLDLAVLITVHGVNAAIVILDLWMADIPLRLLHFYQSVIYYVVYAIFNAAYVFLGGTSCEGNPYIYAVLDWLNAPVPGIISSVQLLALGVGIWIAMWLINMLAKGIKDCCCPRYDTKKIKNTTKINDNGLMTISANQTPMYRVQTLDNNMVLVQM